MRAAVAVSPLLFSTVSAECTALCELHGICIGDSCICLEGFFGDQCLSSQEQCNTIQCRRRGRCYQGGADQQQVVCDCEPQCGWTGPSCQECAADSCPSVCPVVDSVPFTPVPTPVPVVADDSWLIPLIICVTVLPGCALTVFGIWLCRRLKKEEDKTQKREMRVSRHENTTIMEPEEGKASGLPKAQGGWFTESDPEAARQQGHLASPESNTSPILSPESGARKVGFQGGEVRELAREPTGGSSKGRELGGVGREGRRRSTTANSRVSAAEEGQDVRRKSSRKSRVSAVTAEEEAVTVDHSEFFASRQVRKRSDDMDTPGVIRRGSKWGADQMNKPIRSSTAEGPEVAPTQQNRARAKSLKRQSSSPVGAATLTK